MKQEGKRGALEEEHWRGAAPCGAGARSPSQQATVLPRLL